MKSRNISHNLRIADYPLITFSHSLQLNVLANRRVLIKYLLIFFTTYICAPRKLNRRVVALSHR